MKKDKKICIVDYDMTVTGGAEKVAAALANALSNEFEVHLCGINSDGNDVAFALDSKVRYFYMLKGETRLRNMIKKTYKPFRKYIKKNDIDVVLLIGNYPALICGLGNIFMKAKYVYCDHGALMNQWNQKDITGIRLINTLFADCLVVLTNQTRKDYINKFHVSPNKIKCIYNWISPEIYAPKHMYNNESKKILTVGRFGKEKGYDMLLDIAKEVMPKNVDWEWHIFGEGELFKDVEKKIEEYNLTTSVILKGNVQDVYKLYGEYAFFVLTSYREGLPLVLLEAMATGLPMISFDILTGPSEIIKNNVNGFLIESYDCEKMEYGIQELINSQEIREKFSENCFREKSRFSYETILEQWHNLIENC